MSKIDAFCHRQFKKDGIAHIDYDMQEFEDKANQYYAQAEIKKGYAPFCKHIFIDNFAGMLSSVVQITPENEKYIKTGYEARREKQLPVLKRYFPRQCVDLAPSKYLDIILYSKQERQQQNKALGNIDANRQIDYDYAIMAVKPTDVLFETPMDPITAIRNALGMQQGGGGFPLDRHKYMESVKYWQKHAVVKG